MTPDFSRQRAKMVDGQLRTTDVTDPAVLDAMGSVSRELFVGPTKRKLAYIDEDLEVAVAGASRRFIMEPSPFAKLVQLAEVRPGDFVLDVGSATGYSAAVLSRIAGSVIALESDTALAAAATTALSDGGYDNVAVVEGPLAAGHAAEAPYDVIIIEGAVDTVPEALFAQLKEGGRLVVVEGHGNAGVARAYLKSAGVVAGRRGFNAAVKPLPGFEKSAAFQF